MVDQRNFAGNIAYDDLREWLAMAERLGEVRTVKGANCEEDIGLAAEAVLRAEQGPCVVFEDIPGCPKGFRLLLNMFAGTRRNMTLGFPEHLSKWELSDAYREAYLQEQRIVPHVIVDDGPVLENIMMGDDVDVTKFPAPKWHLQYHPRSRGELVECRGLPRPGARQEDCRHRDGRRPSRPHPP
jgi:3-polyprenyl-4-hydroxybenzoate decarboxylase